ncbi:MULTISPECIES: hypothetical protein [unclassified Microcoleus]|uniref:hypothetical protein n=1 Tax=unclassified Microcoleus TaxID=2642155 RepID=UPI002FCF4CD0
MRYLKFFSFDSVDRSTIVAQIPGMLRKTTIYANFYRSIGKLGVAESNDIGGDLL